MARGTAPTRQRTPGDARRLAPHAPARAQAGGANGRSRSDRRRRWSGRRGRSRPRRRRRSGPRAGRIGAAPGGRARSPDPASLAVPARERPAAADEHLRTGDRHRGASASTDTTPPPSGETFPARSVEGAEQLAGRGEDGLHRLDHAAPGAPVAQRRVERGEARGGALARPAPAGATIGAVGGVRSTTTRAEGSVHGRPRPVPGSSTSPRGSRVDRSSSPGFPRGDGPPPRRPRITVAEGEGRAVDAGPRDRDRALAERGADRRRRGHRRLGPRRAAERRWSAFHAGFGAYSTSNGIAFSDGGR